MSKHLHISESDKNLIKNLWDSGLSSKSIIQMLPYNKETSTKMLMHLKKYGFLGKRITSKERILNAYNLGVTNPYELAKMYGLAYNTVQSILSYFHLNRKRPVHNYMGSWRREYNEKTKLIINALNNGYTTKQITQKYNVTRQWVSFIKNNYIKN